MRELTIKRFRLLPLAALLAASLTTVACRQQPATTTTAPTATPPAATTTTTTPTPGTPVVASVAAEDRDFITRAASSGMLEVEASRMAQQKTQNEQVRNFAQRMVDDHTKANEQLRSLAETAGIRDLPAGLLPAHSSHMDRLRALNGQEFDREYAAQIGVASHTEAVALFERASRDASNPEVRRFAEQQLPTLREHREQSEKLAQAVGVSEDRMRSASAPPDLGSLATGASPGTTGMGTTGTGPAGTAATGMGASGTGTTGTGAAGTDTPGTGTPGTGTTGTATPGTGTTGTGTTGTGTTGTGTTGTGTTGTTGTDAQKGAAK